MAKVVNTFVGKFEDLVNLMVSASDKEADAYHEIFKEFLYSPMGIDAETTAQIELKLIEYGISP